jgi:hypothetical protein
MDKINDFCLILVRWGDRIMLNESYKNTDDNKVFSESQGGFFGFESSFINYFWKLFKLSGNQVEKTGSYVALIFI